MSGKLTCPDMFKTSPFQQLAPLGLILKHPCKRKKQEKERPNTERMLLQACSCARAFSCVHPCAGHHHVELRAEQAELRDLGCESQLLGAALCFCSATLCFCSPRDVEVTEVKRSFENLNFRLSGRMVAADVLGTHTVLGSVPCYSFCVSICLPSSAICLVWGAAQVPTPA